MATKRNIAEQVSAATSYDVSSSSARAVAFAKVLLEKAERRLSTISAGDWSVDGRNERAADLAALRSQLEQMSDRELLRFGTSAKYQLGHSVLFGDPGTEELVRLREARAVWRRRKHGTVIADSF